MEEPTNETQATLEQPSNDSPVVTKKGRITKPMAQTNQPNDSAANNDGGKPANKDKKMGLLPTASNSTEVTYSGKVVTETTWSRLPARKLFSVNSDGSHPYFKVSKSSYVDLITGEVTTSVPPSAQQKVYRVALA
jgi:hypothetical protein